MLSKNAIRWLTSAGAGVLYAIVAAAITALHGVEASPGSPEGFGAFGPMLGGLLAAAAARIAGWLGSLSGPKPEPPAA